MTEYRARAVRARVGPVLESAPVAAVGEFAVPERHRESIGTRRPLHERPQVHFRAGDDRRGDVPRPEHDAQPDLARVLPLRARTSRSCVTTRACGKAPPARSRGCDRAEGRLLLGDELLDDWRSRALKGSSVRLRAYYDSHPSADSRLTLDPASKNRYGDPMPKIDRQLDAAATAREGATLAHCTEVFERMAKASNGRLTGKPSVSNYWDHPAGGCRMGTDPATSVCDSYGRTHDHENLFVIGAPTLPTGGCTNGTLTFVAVSLRSAERIAEVDVNRTLGVLISGRGSNLKAIIDAIERGGSTRRSRS